MFAISVFALAISIFASPANCDSKFLRPPEWNSDVDDGAGMEKNIRYAIGDPIQLLWKTDVEKVKLVVVQLIDDVNRFSLLDSSRTEWNAEWDIFEEATNDDDSVYWFALYDHDFTSRLAETQYFNVTAPKRDETKTITKVQTATMTQTTNHVQSRTSSTETISKSTSTDRPPQEETNSNAGLDLDSGMTKGEIAGAAVGGTIGGLLLFGAMGWLVWKRLARRKKDTGVSVVSHNQLPQLYGSDPKAELPGDPKVQDYSPGYARSPGGIHEAP
ncbi:hypothetical protein FBEOM_6781 [Fusarium beomiforme]|uniref:Mid2 domain-containing protein n=1 Tax=Fusarium beomiforme TaxID=44412 RepID=A0A9P5AK67_9HYPO|nr:hypothetical protein FBEOM_6781 [Fusarium beomiforme]